MTPGLVITDICRPELPIQRWKLEIIPVRFETQYTTFLAIIAFHILFIPR